MYVQAIPNSSIWALTREEDRRFHRILAQTLLISLLVGIGAPHFHIPESGVLTGTDSLPRRVWLLPEPPAIAIEPKQPPAHNAGTTLSTTSPQIDQVAASPVVTAREKAERAGVLAMRQSLENLVSRQPTDNRPRDGVDRGTDVAGTRPATTELTANLNTMSDTIQGGVPDMAVLGAGGITESEFSRQGPGDVEAVQSGSSTDSPNTGNRRTQEEIQAILERHKTSIYSIYNRELLVHPGLHGKLVLSITIGSEGNVTRCSVIGSELPSKAMEQQLVALIRGIDFGAKPGVPEVTTRIPIEFFPR